MLTCIGHLPLELVKPILNLIPHLYQIALVNRFFYAAATPLIWHNPGHVNSNGHISTLKAIDIRKYLLLARQHHFYPIPLGHHVRKLCLEREGSVQDLILLLSHTPFVEDLELKNDRLGDDEMQDIIKFCPRLRKIYLYSTSVTNQSMEFLGRHCSHLCDLTLIYNSHLTWKTFVGLKSCGLKRLCITTCPGLVTKESITYLVRFDQLIHLRIYHCWVTGDFVRQLSGTSLPLLQEFEICGRGSQESILNDTLLVPFIESHPQLELLNLSGSCKLTDVSLMAIAKKLSRLRHLELHCIKRISSQGVRHVIRTCHLLEHIRIPACKLIMRSFPEIDNPPELYWDLGEGKNISQFTLEQIQKIRFGTTLDYTAQDDYFCDCEQEDESHDDYYY